MDVHAKELFGSVFEDVLEKAFRAPALVPHQSHVSSLSQPAAQETVRTTSADTVKIHNYNRIFMSHTHAYAVEFSQRLKLFFIPLS